MSSTSYPTDGQPSLNVPSKAPGSASPSLPEIPAPELDLSMNLDSIIGAAKDTSDPEAAKVQKRASNVLKLAQENEKLKEELQAMTDRLEAAERKRAELTQKGSQT